MAAPKNNQYWKLRSKHGRKKLFSTPDSLWDAVCEYFAYCDENPWKATKTKSKGKTVETEETYNQRPYSLTGLMVFLNVGKSYWRQFKAANQEEDFSRVITRIEDIIETQQFEGACVGAFNANIIARRLGLADKQEVDHTTGGQAFQGFGFLPYTPGDNSVHIENLGDI